MNEPEFDFNAPPPRAPTARPRVLRVSELNRLARTLLEDEIGSVWVEGEVSGFKPSQSGHAYFTLKDDKAQISAVLFRGNQRGLKTELKNGMKVKALGEVTIYDAGGRYQMICRQIEEAGLGTMFAELEKLKARLAAEGLFEPSRKRPLPFLPRCIGLVTSPTGAAIHDILNVIRRRFPNLHLLLAPCKVQGEGAAREIVAAIELLNEDGRAEVMIVGRGGGSIEDLWAFNEEPVARAIAASRIPVISAVGHEVDYTLSDLAADLRAPTPSAAAELVVGRKEDFEQSLQTLARRLAREAQAALREMGQRLDEQSMSLRHRIEAGLSRRQRAMRDLELRLRARSPQARLRGDASRVEQARARLLRQISQRIERQQRRLADGASKLERGVHSHLHQRQRRFGTLESRLGALSPLAVLERGYSVTRSASGAVLRSPADAQAGEEIETLLARGKIHSTVTRTHGD